MTGWEHEFAVPFINDGHFYVTAPGPLRSPVKDFSVRRDEGLELIIETRCMPDAQSTDPERPPGTVHLNVEVVELENIGGMKVTLRGVIPYRFRTRDNYRTGESELTEEAKIYEISAVVPGDREARFTIDWVENLPTRPFHWPGSIDTTTEILTTRKIGIGDDGITLFSKESEQSGANHAVKITVDGVDIYLCALERKDGSQLKKPGCIIYVGTPDDQFRKKVRTAVSFALNVYLPELWSAAYDKDWNPTSFKAYSVYSIDGKVLNLPILPPAPLGGGWQRGIDHVSFTRLVNAVFHNYEMLDFGNLSWAYWHALCATPHIASVHFGAAIELLLRQYAATKPNLFSRAIIGDRAMWKQFAAEVEQAISKLGISEEKKNALRENIGDLNRVHQRDTMQAVLKDIGIALGADESQAWKRRNDAAHGIAMETVEELDVIRDIKLLKAMFHRMLLRIVNGADNYHDYATPRFPIRKLSDSIPSA
jgi:hypothetical protein